MGEGFLMPKFDAEAFIDDLRAKNPAEPEFIQAAHEVIETLAPCLEQNPEYLEARLLERIVEPERQLMFRVPWIDDQGRVRVNRGFRAWPPSAPSSSCASLPRRCWACPSPINVALKASHHDPEFPPS